MTRVALNISIVPWALMVLRGAYDLISDHTTRWEFFVPGLVMSALLLGYRALLSRYTAAMGFTTPAASRVPQR